MIHSEQTKNSHSPDSQRVELRNERKEARRRHVKEQFFQAALPLLKQRGTEGLSIGDVTEAAGYSKGSLYNYFDSKEEFLEELFLWAATHFAAAIEEAIFDPHHSFQERLQTLRRFLYVSFSEVRELMMGEMIGTLEKNRKHCERDHGTNNPITHRIFEVISRFFREGMEAGVFRQTDLQRLTLVFIHASIGLGMFSHRSGRVSDPQGDETFFEQLFSNMILKCPCREKETSTHD